MAEEWAKSHGGRLPSTRDEKKEFKVYSRLSLAYVFLINLMFWHSKAVILEFIGSTKSKNDRNG